MIELEDLLTSWGYLLDRSQDQFFLPAIPHLSGSRANSLEDRISNQERTTAVLLDQAFRIKDDIVSYLQGNKGFQQGEAVARQLLENHIQTITSIVKKLSHDIEVLERQIKTRDDVTSGTNFAVQSLDSKHLQGVGDLRGRVARCDASIAKLSGDTNIIRHEIQKQEREIQAIQSTLENYTTNMEMKVMQLLGKIETSNSEQNSHLKTVQGDHHHELQLLDLKCHNKLQLILNQEVFDILLCMREGEKEWATPTTSKECKPTLNSMVFRIDGLLNDLKNKIQSQQKWTENEVRRFEQDQTYLTNQLLGTMKDRLETAEKKMEEGFHYLSKRIENSDKTLRFETDLSQVRNDQNKLHARIVRFEKMMWNELEEIQSEYRSGFQSIRDSLDALKQIQTTKLKLEKEKFKQDMKKIRRKITALQED